MVNEISSTIRARHTVRDFRLDPVPPDVLSGILDDARHAPSWSNTRGYCVAVATGERLERLRRAYAAEFDASKGWQRREIGAIARAVVGRRLPDGDFPVLRPYPRDLKPRSRKVGVELYTHLGVARGDREARDAWNRHNCEFFGAPAVLWVFVHKKMLPFSAQDAGLMLQTLMLSAQARGVGSCALGVLAVWRRLIDAEFEVPKHYGLITGLALGYASDHPANDFRAEHPELAQIPARMPN